MASKPKKLANKIKKTPSKMMTSKRDSVLKPKQIKSILIKGKQFPVPLNTSGSKRGISISRRKASTSRSRREASTSRRKASASRRKVSDSRRKVSESRRKVSDSRRKASD